MALSYNTETFVNINKDLKNLIDSGKLLPENANGWPLIQVLEASIISGEFTDTDNIFIVYYINGLF